MFSVTEAHTNGPWDNYAGQREDSCVIQHWMWARRGIKKCFRPIKTRSRNVMITLFYYT
jgi:hypothetical protein